MSGIANMTREDSLPHSYSQFTAILTVKVKCKEKRTFPLPAAVSTAQKSGVMQKSSKLYHLLEMKTGANNE